MRQIITWYACVVFDFYCAAFLSIPDAVWSGYNARSLSVYRTLSSLYFSCMNVWLSGVVEDAPACAGYGFGSLRRNLRANGTLTSCTSGGFRYMNFSVAGKVFLFVIMFRRHLTRLVWNSKLNTASLWMDWLIDLILFDGSWVIVCKYVVGESEKATKLYRI